MEKRQGGWKSRAGLVFLLAAVIAGCIIFFNAGMTQVKSSVGYQYIPLTLNSAWVRRLTDDEAQRFSRELDGPVYEICLRYGNLSDYDWNLTSLWLEDEQGRSADLLFPTGSQTLEDAALFGQKIPAGQAGSILVYVQTYDEESRSLLVNDNRSGLDGLYNSVTFQLPLSAGETSTGTVERVEE
ncbi:MAG: hypothetical protein Q4C65_09750 [Eubacteriales bacterium]|nr:hypothetical protein [Eubacteriales bacterium]